MKKLITLLSIGAMLGACTKEINNTKALFSRDNLPQTIFTVNSDKDTFLVGQMGTTLSIKKNSFVDGEGHLYHGNISVELMEAVTDEDIILGNMTTQTNGDLLQTGGMFCVTAKAGNDDLSLAVNSSIGVSVPTREVVGDMLVWNGEADSTGRINWKDPKDIIIKKDTIQNDSMPFRIDSFQIIQSRIPAPPAKPKTYSKTDMVFRLAFDTADFPELISYENVHFKLLNKSDFWAADSTIGWFNVDISQLGKDIYQMAFSTKLDGVKVKHTIKVSPVFEPGANYDAAMKEYQKKFASYTKKKAEIEASAMEAQRRQKLEYERIQKESDDISRESLDASVRRTKNLNADAFVSYNFEINSLGFYNCDRLVSEQSLQSVQLTPRFESKQNYDAIQLSIFLPAERVLLSAVRNQNGSYDFFDAFGEYNGQSCKLRLPLGSMAIVFVTGIKGDKPYFDQMQIVVQEKQELEFSLTQMSKDEIKNNISKAVKI